LPIESEAARVLPTLFADPQRLRRRDAATLSYFFDILLVRTPASIAPEARLQDQLMRLQLAVQLSNTAFLPDQPGNDEQRRIALASVKDGSVAFPDERRVGRDVRPRAGVPVDGQRADLLPRRAETIPLARDVCLLLEPIEPRRERRLLRVGSDAVDRVNLRTWRFADRHVFADSQATLDRLRRLARRSPSKVSHPRAKRNVLTFRAPPGNDRFAAANRSRRWPARVNVGGVDHDYVLAPDENPVDIVQEIQRLSGPGPMNLSVLPDDSPPQPVD